MSNFSTNNPIKTSKTSSNIDYLYGPYYSIEEALEIIKPSYRAIGRTIGIVSEDNQIREYWFKKGTEDHDLELKIPEIVIPLYSSEDANKVLKINEEGRLTWDKEAVNNIQVFLELGNSTVDVISQAASTFLYKTGFRFVKTADLNTVPSNIPQTCYFAIESGIYSNFDNIRVDNYCFLCYEENICASAYRWVKYDTYIPFNSLSKSDLTDSLGNSSNKIINQKTITNIINSLEKNSVDIVQSFGDSTEKIMSQKAITDAFKNLDKSLIQITLTTGNNDSIVMSLKAVTEVLSNIVSQIQDPIEIVLETGYSTEKVMSQNAVTTAINNVDKIILFDGVIEEAKVLNIYSSIKGGKVYYVKSAEKFAYYTKEDNNYYTLWENYFKYNNINASEEIVPRKDVLFLCKNILYIWNDSTLEIVNLEKKEIPIFEGVLDSIRVIDNTGYNKHGAVYFIKTPIINNLILEHGIFAYKIRDSYYRSWYNVKDYMSEDLTLPIKNKLFVCNKLLYIYTKDLILLTDLNKTFWEKF